MGLDPKRVLLLVLLVPVLAGALLGVDYWRHDQESKVIDDEVRRQSPGSFIRLTQGTTHYEWQPGTNGRTVVFVHGFSVPYYLWDGTFEAVRAAGFGVLRYDLFGRGLSDRPDLPYDASLFDQQLAELVRELKITGPMDLAGSSMGGPIVATYSRRHPEQIRSVSLFAPGFSRHQRIAFKLQKPVLGEYVMATDIAPTLPAAQLRDFRHPENFPNWPQRFVPQMQYEGFRRALLSTLRHYVTSDWVTDFEYLGRTAKPVFLVWGKYDKDMPFAVSEQVLRAIPQAEFLPVEDAAHVPFLEQPGLVHPAFLDFLRRH